MRFFRPGCINNFRINGLRHTALRWKNSQVLILTGATASGKSDLALELSRHRDVEIVIADSVQVIKYLDIGSNKPSQMELDLIPHHLLDIHEPHEFFSAADYMIAIKPVLEDILSRNKTPLIVGGNTMWVDWLIRGIPNNPGASPEVKTKAAEILLPFKEAGSWVQAVAMVKARDPGAFAEPSPNDWYRLHRQLEIALTNDVNSDSVSRKSGRHPSLLRSLRLPRDDCSSDPPDPLDVDLRCFFIGDDRMQLYRDIDERCERMVKGGIMEETCDLLIRGKIRPLPKDTSGFTETSPAASAAIGYRQTVNYLCRPDFRSDDTSAFLSYVKDFSSATRNYAKKQLHWYRKDGGFLWVNSSVRDPGEGGQREVIPSSGGDLSRSEQLCRELLHWMDSVSREGFAEAVASQHERAEEFVRGESLMHRGARKGVVDWSADPYLASSNGPDMWSGQGYLLRACEGVRDPRQLRNYVQKFAHFKLPPLRTSRRGTSRAGGDNGRDVGDSSSELRRAIQVADECRWKLDQAQFFA